MGMNVGFRKVIKQTGDTVNPSTFKKGVIARVNAQASTADVFIVGGTQTVLKSVPLASHIDPTTVVAGAKCRVDQFDEGNTQDMVVAYIYGGGYVPVQGKHDNFKTGTGLSPNGGATSFVIPHGLVDSTGAAITPDVYGIFIDTNNYYTPANVTYILVISSVDSVNLNVFRAPDNVISIGYYWFAIKFA